MTADDWEPSEAFEKAGDAAWRAAIGMGCSNRDAYLDALKAVRPIIIADARPQIEAAERERIAKYFADMWDEKNSVMAADIIAFYIRALKDSKP